MKPEDIVQTNIEKYFKKLEKLGYPVKCFRRQAGGFSYKMGAADLWVIYNGYHIEIECKAPGEELRPMQEKWAMQCEKLWHCACIKADNVDIVKKFMKERFGVDE